MSLQCKLRAFDDGNGNGIVCRIETQPYLLAELQLLSPLPFMQWLGAAEPPLELVQLKQPGRRLMTARDFINSCRVPFPLNFTSP